MEFKVVKRIETHKKQGKTEISKYLLVYEKSKFLFLSWWSLVKVSTGCMDATIVSFPKKFKNMEEVNKYIENR